MNRRPEHLTAREEQILRCIRRWIEERGEGPSVRQLADDIGLSSTASVAYHLGNLEERGALVRDGRGWRTCRLVRTPPGRKAHVSHGRALNRTVPVHGSVTSSYGSALSSSAP